MFLTLSVGTGSCFLSPDFMKVQSAGEISRSHKAFLVCHHLFQLLQNLCFQRSFPVGQIGSSNYKSNYSLKGWEDLWSEVYAAMQGDLAADGNLCRIASGDVFLLEFQVFLGKGKIIKNRRKKSSYCYNAVVDWVFWRLPEVLEVLVSLLPKSLEGREKLKKHSQYVFLQNLHLIEYQRALSSHFSYYLSYLLAIGH